MIRLTPCATTECPSEIFRKDIETGSIGDRAEILAACQRIFGQIIEAGDEQILCGSDETAAAEAAGIISFGPNACPMMTPYSLEVIEETN